LFQKRRSKKIKVVGHNIFVFSGEDEDIGGIPQQAEKSEDSHVARY
jgi:hypothetical protein